jgi:hypothetical protein
MTCFEDDVDDEVSISVTGTIKDWIWFEISISVTGTVTCWMMMIVTG